MWWTVLRKALVWSGLMDGGECKRMSWWSPWKAYWWLCEACLGPLWRGDPEWGMGYGGILGKQTGWERYLHGLIRRLSTRRTRRVSHSTGISSIWGRCEAWGSYEEYILEKISSWWRHPNDDLLVTTSWWRTQAWKMTRKSWWSPHCSRLLVGSLRGFLENL